MMITNYKIGVDFDFVFNMSIVGDHGVGKTTILQRFAQNTFSTDNVATIGYDVKIRTLEIDSTRCKLVISDLGGQDSFKYALSSFYRNANGIAICFDIVNLESFRNLNNWLENVQRLCREQTPIFLVGTKSDLKLRRKISHDMIEAYVAKNNLSYVETSSKTNENVEECFVHFTRILMAHIHQKDGSIIDLNNRQKTVTNLETSGC
ncbi:unnamed protein product [Rotaria magnacalcarata]|uniref:Uncharacterized protein n=1 Tax=Rotaria magnacalcarata TaxID=392030 RepID=A0A815RQS6_9BILA|nr:unnamed protein product [Rotaria magnacalcarata]